MRKGKRQLFPAGTRRLFFYEKILHNFLLSGIIILSALGVFSGAFGTQTAPANTEYLRIHIRANSNEGEDQAVKYLVRDAVVAYLTPIVAETETREEAEAALDDCLPGLVRTAEQVLEKTDFSTGRARRSGKRSSPPACTESIRWKPGCIARSSYPWVRVRGIIGGASSIRPCVLRANRAIPLSIGAKSSKLSAAGRKITDQSFLFYRHAP